MVGQNTGVGCAVCCRVVAGPNVEWDKIASGNGIKFSFPSIPERGGGRGHHRRKQQGAAPADNNVHFNLKAFLRDVLHEIYMNVTPMDHHPPVETGVR